MEWDQLGVLPSSVALASVALIDNSRSGATAVSWSVPPITSLLSAPVVPWQQVPHSLPPPPVPAAALSLSPASEPFPLKLVEKVQSGKFVEMRELLTDNITLLQQLDVMNMQCSLPALPGVMRPRLREVTTLPSWLYCFLAYVAIRSSDPETRDMLAYGRLLIRESQRHGGSGWLAYDKVFRQQAALDSTLRWNSIHPGIQAATLTGSITPSGVPVFCTLCREPGHASSDCALAYLQQPVTQSAAAAAIPPRRPVAPRFYQPSRRQSFAEAICYSWNAGRCIYPGSCHFRHVCSRCHQQHMARDCTNPGNNGPRGEAHGRPGNLPAPKK